MNWNDKRSFESKLQKILDRIDTLAAKRYAVSLIGVSAGANITLHAFAQRPDAVHKVALICGAIQDPSAVGERVKRENPAFWQSMLALHDGVLKSLTPEQCSRITSFIPLSDETVDPKNMLIDGAQLQTLPTHGHTKSIAYAITLHLRIVTQSVL